MSRGKRPAGSFPVPAEAGTKAGPFEAGEKQAKTENKIGKKGGETLLFSDTLLTHFYAIFGRFWPYLRDPQKQQKTLKTQGFQGFLAWQGQKDLNLFKILLFQVLSGT